MKRRQYRKIMQKCLRCNYRCSTVFNAYRTYWKRRRRYVRKCIRLGNASWTSYSVQLNEIGSTDNG